MTNSWILADSVHRWGVLCGSKSIALSFPDRHHYDTYWTSSLVICSNQPLFEFYRHLYRNSYTDVYSYKVRALYLTLRNCLSPSSKIYALTAFLASSIVFRIMLKGPGFSSSVSHCSFCSRPRVDVGKIPGRRGCKGGGRIPWLSSRMPMAML